MKKYLTSFLIFSATSAAIAHAPADSVAIQTGIDGAENEKDIPKEPGTATVASEQDYFDFLRILHAEQPKKSGHLLGRLARSSKDLGEHKISEYDTYLKIYFPNAHSDHVQRFMIESFVDQETGAPEIHDRTCYGRNRQKFYHAGNRGEPSGKLAGHQQGL